jgi:pimeloyl-ACP methyl ester carboxylesterase
MIANFRQDGTVQQIPINVPEGVRFIPNDPSGDAVLVIAGSSGRVDTDRARMFAEHGFVAESIRWFGGQGQHAEPWEIPLECFLDRVTALHAVSNRVWVVGSSLGAEAAMLTGAHDPTVAGVIAFAPTDVVWPWNDYAGIARSHWTLAGIPVPFVPIAWDTYVRETPARFRPLYEQSYARSPERVEAAVIPVEQIQQLVLVAGGDDQVWPSTESAQRISARRHGAGHETTVVTRADAGHRTILPGETVVAGGQAMHRGGSEDADRALGRAAWAAIRSTVAR